MTLTPVSRKPLQKSVKRGLRRRSISVLKAVCSVSFRTATTLSFDVVTVPVDALNCDLFLNVGTSAVVYPAAGLAAEARRRGAFTVEINLEATPASNLLDLSIQAPAEEVLPKLEQLLS